MKLQDLKEWMLIPQKEYKINQTVNIRGTDVHILSFTIEENRNRLWLIYNQEDRFEDELEDYDEGEPRERARTNREDKLENIERTKYDKSFFINEMEIQNQTIRFNSSTSFALSEMNMESMMKLQHFVEKDLIPDKLNDIRLKNLCIAEYGQEQDENPPTIDTGKELNIKLKIGSDSREVLIGHPFKAKIGRYDRAKEIRYFDKELSAENSFYINEIYSFDIYDYIEKQVEQIEDLEMQENMYKDLIKAMEGKYPRGKNLAVIKYESLDDSQLNFYMKDYLDRDQREDINIKSSTDDVSIVGGASSIGFIFSSSEKSMGAKGYKLRECVLQPIDKDFKDELEIELFSKYIQIPGEIIIIL